jgi:Tfp pilus assembly protein PilZ
MSGQEKRKSVRVEKPLLVRYSPEAGMKDRWSVSYIKNISEEGLLFDTNKQFIYGEKVNLMIKIPLDPDNWIKTKGSVVESTPFIGRSFLTRLQFTCLEDKQRKLIGDYIVWLLEREKPKSRIDGANDKRKSARIYKNLMISYGTQNYLGVVEKWDITTARNFSKTGMVFTSGYACEGEIDFIIKIPSHPDEPLHIRGKVIESSLPETAGPLVAKDAFITRVEFIGLKKEHEKLLGDYVDWFIKNEKEKKEGE